MLDEARASQLQRTGAGARQVWSCLNAPQRVLSFLPCHLAQEHNMGWKCVETAYYSDCPLPCAHGPALTLPTGRDVNHLARQVTFGSYPSSSHTCSWLH